MMAKVAGSQDVGKKHWIMYYESVEKQNQYRAGAVAL